VRLFPTTLLSSRRAYDVPRMDVAWQMAAVALVTDVKRAMDEPEQQKSKRGALRPESYGCL
jgi:hypothetical protein